MTKDQLTIHPNNTVLACQEISVSQRISPSRYRVAVAGLGALCLIYSPVLLEWYRIAVSDDLHSHIILIPLVSVYLLAANRGELAVDSRPSPVIGLAVLALSVASAIWAFAGSPPGSVVDLIALKISSLLGFLWGWFLLFLGKKWFHSVAFPLAFLVFMIPLPDQAVVNLERFLMMWSAWLSEALFTIGGIPVFRSGQVIELPGMVLEVAQECSGIRSSWVLFITSVLASHLLLPTFPRKLALIAVVLPLAILRNSLRIFVIGWLCVNYGSEMIDSWIHRKGGPIFFAASLVPLILVAWWLRSIRIRRSTHVN